MPTLAGAAEVCYCNLPHFSVIAYNTRMKKPSSREAQRGAVVVLARGVYFEESGAPEWMYKMRHLPCALPNTHCSKSDFLMTYLYQGDPEPQQTHTIHLMPKVPQPGALSPNVDFVS